VAVGLSLLVALRVVTLALRDWRDPIQASFGWGAGILLIEIVVLGGPAFSRGAWLLVPLFFVASLASRAASVRLAEGTEVVGRTSIPWLGLATALGAVTATVGVVAALVGGRGGLLERLGRIIPLILYGVIYALVFVLSWILRPIGWTLHALGFHAIDPSRLTRHIRHTLSGFGHSLTRTTHPGIVPRILGLVLLTLLVWVLAWFIVQQRRRWVERELRVAEVVAPAPSPPRVRESWRRDRARRRRELPEDTVRRWYAETLIAMERRGVSRVPSRTPAEFLREAVEAFPGAAASLTALTRAYEDVRYGTRAIAPERLDTLEAHRGIILASLGPPVKPKPERAVTD
jgi:hypothetical protein